MEACPIDADGTFVWGDEAALAERAYFFFTSTALALYTKYRST